MILKNERGRVMVEMTASENICLSGRSQILAEISDIPYYKRRGDVYGSESGR